MMHKRLRLAAAVALGGLLFVSCGKSFEATFRDFTNLYGQVADILADVDDVESAEAAKPRIEALVPAIQKAGQEMAQASARITNPNDVDLQVMAACAQQQQRLVIELKRLSDDREVWPVIRPALERTMLLKAMPPR